MTIDPRSHFAAGLETIQSSKLALTPAQLQCLERNGVVIAWDRTFDSFVVGYVELYGADLPLFISADSILHALHRTHEDFLASIETSVIAPTLDAMLVSLRDNLARAGGAWSDEARADLDLYLTIALRILRSEMRAGEGGAPIAFIDDAGGQTWTQPVEEPDGRARAHCAGRVRMTGRFCEANRDFYARRGKTANVVLSANATLTIVADDGRVLETFVVPHGAHIFCRQDAHVERREILADWDRFSQPILAQVDGRLVWEGLVRDRTYSDVLDEVTGLSRREVLPIAQGELQPSLAIVDDEGRVLTIPGTDAPARYALPERTSVWINDGTPVQAADVLAGIPRYPRPPRPEDKPVQPSIGAIANASPERIAHVMESLRAADGVRMIELFGAERPIDTSQMRDAGEDPFRTPARDAYFRTIRWLNAVSFHLVVEASDGHAVARRQLEAAALLRTLLVGDAKDHWDRIAQFITAFTGPFDNATLFDLDAVCARAGVDDISELHTAETQAVTEACMAVVAPRERIQGEPIGPRVPLARCWLFGTSFSLDALVFHEVVHNRIRAKRMMPSPLDVAYAALTNCSARTLLRDELARYAYGAELEQVRGVVDTELASNGTPSLYNQWLATLRSLARSRPGRRDAEPLDAERTTAWNRRVLNTQLASWSELRHATRLYAKHSRSWGIICSFPDAYVEPCPAFFSALVEWARTGRDVARSMEPVAPRLAAEMTAYFARLTETSTLLGEIAEQQEQGLPLTPEQLRFINQAVTLRPREMCGPLEADGWFPMLYRETSSGTIPGYPVTAVHTSDLDEHERIAGDVLYVGTGAPRLTAITVSTPDGPRAYAGLVSSYYQRITHNYEWPGSALFSPRPIEWLAGIAVGELSTARPRGTIREEFLRDEQGAYHLAVAVNRTPANAMQLYLFPYDVHDPVSNAVIARAGDDVDPALVRIRAAGVHAIRVPAAMLLDGTVAEDLHDENGTIIASAGAQVDGDLLERLHRTRVTRIALLF